MSRSISTPSGWGNVSLPGQLLPAAVSTQGGGSPWLTETLWPQTGQEREEARRFRKPRPRKRGRRILERGWEEGLQMVLNLSVHHVYLGVYHKWGKFQCPTQTYWIHVCMDGVWGWGGLCVYQAPQAMRPAFEETWGSSALYFIVRKPKRVSHCLCPQQCKVTAIWRRAAVYGLGSEGIRTSKHVANLDLSTGQKHLEPRASTGGTGQANSASTLTDPDKKKTRAFCGSCSHYEFQSARTQAQIQEEQSLENSNWSEPSPTLSENYRMCSNSKEIHQNYHLEWGKLKSVNM